ncbi:TetR/AcrR family transcriptional regulator [Nocardioides sp.]|uniref:TetR/AcrR family transcriptional regulator n=1 Tax=Nocardioides sp. TaxID=35761 RepID=UPI003566485E
MTSLRHNPEFDAVADRAPRDAYLDAARACILDVGWRRTTLTEVARRAGVSRMTIYRTWADMPTLLGDLMTREWAGVVTAQVEGSTGGTALDRLVSGVVGTARTLRENELFVRIVELDPELILPYLFSRRGRSQDHILSLTTEAIAACQGDGSVRPGDPALLARAALLAVQGFVLSAHTMADEGVTLDALDAELTTLLTRSLAA